MAKTGSQIRKQRRSAESPRSAIAGSARGYAVRGTDAHIPLFGVGRRLGSVLGALFSRVAALFSLKFLARRCGAALVTFTWYLPAIFVALVAVTALYSPSAAVLVFLCGCLGFAGVLIYVARLIKRRYHELLARMPKIDGQVPKRLELHAVIMGVGERQYSDLAMNDSSLSPDVDELYDALDAEDDNSPESADEPFDGKALEPRNDDGDPRRDAIADEDMSAFEMFEVPLVRREKNRKPMIH